MDKEANWLPAPVGGPFNLTVRNCWPKDAVLDGSYKVPPVRKMEWVCGTWSGLPIIP